MQQKATETEQATLSSDDQLRFSCHETLPCFTQCCRDVNIYLTPYDVLRLRRALKLGSTEFLAKYTGHFLAGAGHIPVVQLAMETETLRCQFVSDDGCTVYGDRPWACRMYPLDLASREGEYTLIVGRERCLGLLEKGTQTVGEWLDCQGIEPYAETDRAFQGVMPPGFNPEKAVGPGLGKILYLAYDLDRFLDLLRDPHFREIYDIGEDLLRRVTEDDEALLRLAYQYIRSQLEEIFDSTL